MSGPVVAMVWQGLDVVKQGRVMLGATNPLQSAPGTIRGDFCVQVQHYKLFSLLSAIFRLGATFATDLIRLNLRTGKLLIGSNRKKLMITAAIKLTNGFMSSIILGYFDYFVNGNKCSLYIFVLIVEFKC